MDIYFFATKRNYYLKKTKPLFIQKQANKRIHSSIKNIEYEFMITELYLLPINSSKHLRHFNGNGSSKQ